jgi:hypothetical protein
MSIIWQKLFRQQYKTGIIFGQKYPEKGRFCYQIHLVYPSGEELNRFSFHGLRKKRPFSFFTRHLRLCATERSLLFSSFRDKIISYFP